MNDKEIAKEITLALLEKGLYQNEDCPAATTTADLICAIYKKVYLSVLGARD